MKLISWNVNGLRACLTHGFADSFAALDADIFSVQETKMQPGQADFAPEGYTEYTYSAEKKGYSGTACWCRQVPLAVTTGIGLEEHDHEGRVLTLEYPGFYLVNCYTPNSQDGLKRLDYRMTWEDAFRAYLLGLDAKKPVILCGDLNVAHTEMDIKNAKTEAEVKAIEEAAQAEIDKILTTEEKAIVAALDNVEKRDFATKSKVITRKGGKKVIRLTWTAPDGVDVDGYEIFRSTKKNSGFGKKPYFTTSNTSYTNTKDLKTGKTYYYKVRAFVVINGERVYTDYSLKANRKL